MYYPGAVSTTPGELEATIVIIIINFEIIIIQVIINKVITVIMIMIVMMILINQVKPITIKERIPALDSLIPTRC